MKNSPSTKILTKIKMNRLVSTTVASIAMAQSATVPSTICSGTTIATTAIISHDEGIKGNISGSGVEIEGAGNWMTEYEKFFNDENNYDYQGFLNSLKAEEQADFMNYVSSTVVLERQIETDLLYKFY